MTSSSIRKVKVPETKSSSTNVQILGIHAGGQQIFVRITQRVRSFDFVLKIEI